MKKYMELPADYAVLSDDEMTYTTGGSAVGGIVTIVGVAVLASSYVWGISQARDWLSVDSNRRGNPLTVMGRAMDAISDDMSKSPSNFLRDVVSTGTVVALAPHERAAAHPVSFPCGFSGASIFRQTGAHRAVLGYCS